MIGVYLFYVLILCTTSRFWEIWSTSIRASCKVGITPTRTVHKVVPVLSFNWAPHHEGVLGEWKYSSAHSLTSALDGGEWSASRPCRFTPSERALGTHWIGSWVGPRVVLDAVVKRKIPSPCRESNLRTPIVQPVAQRYTDWAITAVTWTVYTKIKFARQISIYIPNARLHRNRQELSRKRNMQTDRHNLIIMRSIHVFRANNAKNWRLFHLRCHCYTDITRLLSNCGIYSTADGIIMARFQESRLWKLDTACESKSVRK
jgi:hypothetical protein